MRPSNTRGSRSDGCHGSNETFLFPMPCRAPQLHRVLLQSLDFRFQHVKLTFCLKALSTVHRTIHHQPPLSPKASQIQSFLLLFVAICNLLPLFHVLSTLSNMTVAPTSLLDFQVYLEENPGPLPDQLSGFAFAVHRNSSTLTSNNELKGCKVTSASAPSDIITTMYSSVSTFWSIASLVGPLLPAGFLVPVRGKLATDPIHLHYIVAATFIGTKKDHYNANTSHLMGFSGQEVYSRGDDLDAPLLPMVPCQSTLSPTMIA